MEKTETNLIDYYIVSEKNIDMIVLPIPEDINGINFATDDDWKRAVKHALMRLNSEAVKWDVKKRVAFSDNIEKLVNDFSEVKGLIKRNIRLAMDIEIEKEKEDSSISVDDVVDENDAIENEKKVVKRKSNKKKKEFDIDI